jgi:hypothetical protein
MSTDRLAILSKPTFERIGEAIKAGDFEMAKALCRLKSTEHVPVHDGYMHWVSGMLSFIYERYGPEKLNSSLAFTQSTMWEPLFDHFENLDLKTKVKNICSLWHWHCTTFQLTEDDEKFTFRLDPCGSGMRLERAGAYEGPGAYVKVKESHPMTFMQQDFSVYSTHCAVNNRVQLARGLPLFIVEGWTPDRKNGVCIQHTYKTLRAVPDEQFHRIGLRRETPTATTQDRTGGRLFSDAELTQLSTPPWERAIHSLDAGMAKAAIELCENESRGWPGLHDQYRDWVSLLLLFIRDNFGEAVYDEAIDSTLERMLATIYRDVVEQRDLNRATALLAGIWRAFGEAFQIVDEGKQVVFTTSLKRIFSPRFADKLQGVLDDFCEAHNRVVERWSTERDSASSSFLPRLSLVAWPDASGPEVAHFPVYRQYLMAN